MAEKNVDSVLLILQSTSVLKRQDTEKAKNYVQLSEKRRCVLLSLSLDLIMKHEIIITL